MGAAILGVLVILAVIHLAHSRGPRSFRGRLISLSFGLLLCALGVIGAVLAVGTFLFFGGVSSELTFAQQPVRTVLALLLHLAVDGIFVAFGWHLFKVARRNMPRP